MSAINLKERLEVADEDDVCALRGGMAKGSLRNERARGDGPPFQRIGKKVFYPLKSLRKFLEDSTVTPSRASTLIDSKPRRS
jgi:hypothetical protein